MISTFTLFFSAIIIFLHFRHKILNIIFILLFILHTEIISVNIPISIMYIRLTHKNQKTISQLSQSSRKAQDRNITDFSAHSLFLTLGKLREPRAYGCNALQGAQRHLHQKQNKKKMIPLQLSSQNDLYKVI